MMDDEKQPFWLNVAIEAPKSAKPILSARAVLIRESLGSSLEAWLGSHRPQVVTVVVHVIYLHDGSTQRPLIQEDKQSTGRMTNLFLTVLPIDGFVEASSAEETTLRLVGHVEASLEELARGLCVSQLPPKILLTRRERLWLQNHDRPGVPVQRMVFKAHSTLDIDFLDIWVTLKKFTSIVEIERLLASMTEEQRKSFKKTSLELLEKWQLAIPVESLLAGSDSEAYHGISLLLGGRHLWEKSLTDPDSYMHIWPVAPEIAEEVLEMIENI